MSHEPLGDQSGAWAALQYDRAISKATPIDEDSVDLLRIVRAALGIAAGSLPYAWRAVSRSESSVTASSGLCSPATAGTASLQPTAFEIPCASGGTRAGGWSCLFEDQVGCPPRQGHGGCRGIARWLFGEDGSVDDPQAGHAPHS